METNEKKEILLEKQFFQRYCTGYSQDLLPLCYFKRTPKCPFFITLCDPSYPYHLLVCLSLINDDNYMFQQLRNIEIPRTTNSMHQLLQQVQTILE